MASVTDNFNRANENPIAAPWSSVGGAVQLTSNAIATVGASTDNCVRYSGAGLSGNQFAELTLVTLGASTEKIGPTVRTASTGITFYAAIGSTANHLIIKAVNNTFTNLAGGGAALVAGDVLRLEASSSSLQAKRNGTNTISATDSAITTGDPGAYFQFASASGSMDSFSAADLLQGQGLLLSHTRNYLVGVR